MVNKTGMGYMYRNGQEKHRLIYARWFLTLLTGVVTALTAVFLLYCTTLLTSLKLHLLEYSIHHELEKHVLFGTAFWSIVAFNAGLVIIAATITVFYEPVAAGSGTRASLYTVGSGSRCLDAVDTDNVWLQASRRSRSRSTVSLYSTLPRWIQIDCGNKD